MSIRPEPWLRGPLPGLLPELQPAAHALLQAMENIETTLSGFDDRYLWHKPAGRASVGFHLQHMAGVLDRMISYAEGRQLSKGQFDFLANEGIPFPGATMSVLRSDFSNRAAKMIDYMKKVQQNELLQIRTVGREKRPSTLIGILFHAAEHIQRHTGQLLVTVSVVQYKGSIP